MTKHVSTHPAGARAARPPCPVRREKILPKGVPRLVALCYNVCTGIYISRHRRETVYLWHTR